jgi:DNA-directed RNA polymerase alpha subunit
MRRKQLGEQKAFPNYEVLKWPVEELGLPEEITKSLKRAHLPYVGDVTRKHAGSLCQLPKVGWQGVDIIKASLAVHGLRLDHD